jgi:plasmid stabilization system protein ParE
MSFRLLLRPEARVDIREALLWYEDQKPGLGDRLDAELTRLFDRILRSPLQFPEVEQDVRRGLLRKFPYEVYFLLEGDAIFVLAVLHQRRHPDVWKRRIPTRN